MLIEFIMSIFNVNKYDSNQWNQYDFIVCTN